MTESHYDVDLGETDTLLSLLAENLEELRLSAGETLFEQDDFDDRLFVLDTGELEVSVLAASGRKLSLNRLQPGSVFGEIAFFDPGRRTARIKALVSSRLRFARQAALLEGMTRNPKLASALLQLAGRRMRWMSRQLEDQVFLPPESRLAAKTLHLSRSDSEIAMSQAQLADYVGVTRELVSRILSDWRRAGLVELSRGRIRVLDRSGLMETRDSEEV
ncbi:Crp/Fnr family transcriptional regulator [Tropicimonas sp. TH_r6]|uniref:Crp/Fnr family transcriptional regulator n=1 Tax=Tropicimonas sp. TH_r6 TaxID=3082085 RepID=UPI00295339FA|nr:Crp/Fnr family transcriptional regulator [Tropicimonas sp. TH_r6]MDV7142562.1 Crp/Fnr family transcriptional regulator [Tropicimonas sp. TH_r6]